MSRLSEAALVGSLQNHVTALIVTIIRIRSQKRVAMSKHVNNYNCTPLVPQQCLSESMCEVEYSVECDGMLKLVVHNFLYVCGFNGVRQGIIKTAKM